MRSNPHNSTVFLIKPKSAFKEELLDTIRRGRLLLTQQVQQEEERVNWVRQSRQWSANNEELLQTAFSKRGNAYYKKYYQAMFLPSEVQFRTQKMDFAERVDRTRRKLEQQVKYLDGLVSILPQLPQPATLVTPFAYGEDQQSQVRTWIQKDRLEKALEAMLGFSLPAEVQNEVRLLLSNFNGLRRDYEQGLLTREAFTTQQARIKKAVLEMVAN